MSLPDFRKLSTNGTGATEHRFPRNLDELAQSYTLSHSPPPHADEPSANSAACHTRVTDQARKKAASCATSQRWTDGHGGEDEVRTITDSAIPAHTG